MSWHRLDAENTTKLLDTVKSSGEALLFSQRNNEAKCMRLPFYTDLLLYRIENTASLPIFSMDFLGNDEGFLYLDGSDSPLVKAKEKNQLSLREDNIASYIQFYFFNVIQEEGEIYPIFKKYPLQELANHNIHATQQEIPEGTPELELTQEANGFNVKVPLFYSGTLMHGELKVSNDGDINIITVTPLLGQNLGSSTSDAWT